MVFFTYFCAIMLVVSNPTTIMQENVTLQSIAENKDIQIVYSDKDIVIFDTIQQFVDISAAHLGLNAIAICLKGKMQGLLNGQLLELYENQVGIIPAGGLVTNIMVSPDCKFKTLCISAELLHDFLRDKMTLWDEMMYVRHSHTLAMEESEIAFFTHFYEMLEMCLQQQSYPFRSEVIQALLRSGMLALCGAFQYKLSNEAEHSLLTSNSHFHHFLNILHQEPVKHRTVDWYAAQLCISPKYLSAICKNNSGRTAIEWITDNVLEDIRYHLRQTDLSIKQISDKLGFSNPSFFGKYVKEHLGVTPVRYRQGDC